MYKIKYRRKPNYNNVFRTMNVVNKLSLFISLLPRDTFSRNFYPNNLILVVTSLQVI